MKKFVFSLLFTMTIFIGFAQNGTGFSGVVIDSKTQKPLRGVIASVQNTALTEITNSEGRFTFKNVPAGSQLLMIKNQGYKDQLLAMDVVEGKILDIGLIPLEEDITQEQQLTLITITDNDLGDDNSGSENTAGLLQATRDGIQQAAAFNWGQARFRLRGLDNQYSSTMINGVTMNKIYDGRPQWSNWGGLNDATRNQEFTMGSAPSDYTFGGILGTQEINTRASIYRPGSRISFSGTNTNYNWRAMATHASGMDKNGWAYVISASRRWAQEAFFEGTNYSANSLFASVEKKINDRHSLNFTSIYAENSRARNSANTDEVNNLAGIKYNSYWGWQDGKKRNSRVRDLVEPILMLNHFWKVSDKTNLNTSLTHQFGKIGNSRIDFQGVDNPDPTYYRNLPSYYTSLYDGMGNYLGNTPENLALANWARGNFLENKQMDWNAMYEANRSTHDGRSVYVLYEDRTDDKTWTANTVLSSQLSDNIVLNAGGNYRYLISHNFQNLLDLLGGQYYKDFDNFQTGDQSQPDLNNQNRNVVVGDTFGYNYKLYANTFSGFTQFKFTYKKADFYLAQTFSRSQYQREGLYKNGLYPTNSFGKSDKYRYDNFGFKGGLTYKFTGKHFFNFNGVYMTQAPALRNLFPNARLNHNTLPQIVSETITSADASYIIRAPRFKSRITGFYSNIKNATETSFYFGDGIFTDDDGDGGDAFVAETMTNIERLNVGIEAGFEYQITSTIKIMANASYGEYIYNNNPNVFLNNDNNASVTNTNPVVDFGTAKLKGYRLNGTPQSAYSVGVEYRDPKFWWIGANANYLANNYMDVSGLLRTDRFFTNPLDPWGLPFPEATNERASQLLAQERFADFYLVNLTGGKSWKVKNITFGFFASINNLFNETYKTSGFEQSRNANFRELNQDVSSGTPAFGPKYFYGFGRNYFVNLYINF